jgi:serine protease AprX
VDVVAFDKEGEVSEDELLVAIDSGLERFPEVKVWNLSLGSSDPCGDDSFSEFGTALDERAERRGVLFVIAAGNYSRAPFRTWPPQDGIGEADRICPPADSMRGLTVGSVAHLETASTCVRLGDPSPFSRRGPGPAYVMKPELAFYGGNYDPRGQYVQAGVVSIDGHGHRAENIGTSFANPLASTLAANVEAELRTPSMPRPRPLVKALMVHGAFLRNSPLDVPRFNYTGLGCPPDIAQIINCRQSAATVIFQVPVRAKPDFGKRPFPLPPCLFEPGVGLQCEIFMTLMYEPPLDRNFGVEYCRLNVNATLGTVDIDRKIGKEKYNREVGPVPKDLSDGYEEELIKHGYKWSPLKLYHRKFSRGPQGKYWRLTLDVLHRSDFESDDEQEVVLIVTIRGRRANMPVYDELVREMDRLGWGAQDLQVRSRLRMQS